MPTFTLRWTNRSHSNQDWLLSNRDNFHLPPNHVREAQVTINHNYTFQIAVSAHNAFAAANLTYTAGHAQPWTLPSHVPNEWQLAVGAGFVTVRCLLEDVHGSAAAVPEYRPGDVVPIQNEDIRDD